MVASVAVLSDIHGVLPALEAVLSEPDVMSSELIVITGDHAAGPPAVQVRDPRRGGGGKASQRSGKTHPQR
ncbi:metallophosphoesterase family protein, partial [Streptomyces sp. NPDC055897]